MTEEVTGQQPVPQGESASSTTEVNNLNTEQKTEATVTSEEKSDAPKKLEKKPDWYIDTISGLRIGIRERDQEIERVKAENETLKTGKVTQQAQTPESLTDAEINRRANELANVRQFNEKCDTIAQKGEQEFPGFKAALGNLHAVGALGPNVSPAFLQTVAELPEAHKLLNHLGNNPDEAARIALLPQVKMALELARIESALGKPKEVSKAPAPIKPVTGTGGGNGDLSDPALSMEEYSRIRAQQRKAKEERR